MTSVRIFGLIVPAICLSTVSFAASFEVIGADEQFAPSALASDGSTLVGNGLVPPLGTMRLGMTWTSGSGLSFMPTAGSVQYSLPQGISGNGSAVVGYNQDSSNALSAWRWTATQGYQSIAPTPVGTSSAARAVSNDGNTVVGQYNTGSTYTPFVWTATCGPITLPVTSGGTPLLSGDGTTVAGETNQCDGFTWTAAGGVKAMHALPGAINIQPTAISADGSRIYGQATLGGVWFLFRYANGTMTSLGAPSFYDPSTAGVTIKGCVADGSELVGSQIGIDPKTNNPSVTPWVWTQTGGFASVQDLLASDGINLGSYYISDITGISSDGQMLYGRGLDNGIQPSGWIAVVPEPSGVGAVIAIVAVVSLKRRKTIRDMI